MTKIYLDTRLVPYRLHPDTPVFYISHEKQCRVSDANKIQKFHVKINVLKSVQEVFSAVCLDVIPHSNYIRVVIQGFY